MAPDDLPRLGLGTFSAERREQWRENVRIALDVGFRHVDTAQVYGNEEFVGEALRRSPVDRSDVFLATKTVHHDIPSGVEAVPDAIDGCLDRLGVAAVDLLYVHWPTGIYEHGPVLSAFDAAYQAGKARRIGLSNFTPELLAEARAILDAPVFAHQVEMHPLCPQPELVADAQEHDHWLVAYSPLAKGKVFDIPVIQTIADKHDVSPAQVSLAWLLEHDNVAAIPKASSRDHMVANLEAREVPLDSEDLARIDAIKERYRVVDPDHAPWNR